MKTRYYIVDNDGEITLVQAQSPAAARNHVARSRITVRYATQADLIALLSQGLTPQQAGAEPEEEPA